MTQILYNGVDAAYPGNPLPDGTQVLAAYIGIPGPHGPDTPHIWTPQEWNGYIDRAPELRLCPIYVHNYPDADPVADAIDAAAAAAKLGWVRGYTGAARRIIALDLETMIDPAWVSQFIAQIDREGYRCMDYGTGSTVRHNPTGAGYWEAIWTGRRPTALGPDQQGQQYLPNHDGWDYDVFAQNAYEGFGHGPRLTT